MPEVGRCFMTSTSFVNRHSVHLCLTYRVVVLADCPFLLSGNFEGRVAQQRRYSSDSVINNTSSDRDQKSMKPDEFRECCIVETYFLLVMCLYLFGMLDWFLLSSLRIVQAGLHYT